MTRILCNTSLPDLQRTVNIIAGSIEWNFAKTEELIRRKRMMICPALLSRFRSTDLLQNLAGICFTAGI